MIVATLPFVLIDATTSFWLLGAAMFVAASVSACR